MPEFFVVGHHKCGTSALYEMLRRHPQIFMPEVKETWYFSPELRSVEKRRRPAERPETIEQYLALFAHAKPEQRLGENSPAYLLSHHAAQRIHDAQPEARIIAILREPAAFLHSFHLQCLRNHVESEKDFAKAIALEPDRREGRRLPRHSPRPHELLYSEHVRYVEQLERYHRLFGRERVLVLVYEEFRADNEATVREVLRFLEVDDSQPIAQVEANPSYSVRSPQLNELMRSLYMGRGPAARALKGAINATTPRALRHGALGVARRRVVYGEPPRPDERVMLELRRRFAGEVAAVSEYLGRDLVGLWGYDQLG
ncbi:MAG TPA: sulfotransferase [Solirubrobacteraceae bacterium]|nr:sulfotransferase [Solirubrobacteraceae bacterium]